MEFLENIRKFTIAEPLAGSVQCVSGNGANSAALTLGQGGDEKQGLDRGWVYQLPAARHELDWQKAGEGARNRKAGIRRERSFSEKQSTYQCTALPRANNRQATHTVPQPTRCSTRCQHIIR